MTAVVAAAGAAMWAARADPENPREASREPDPSTRTIAVPLQVAQTSGCVASPGGVELLDRLVTQDSDIIIIEAEDAAALEFQDDAYAAQAGRGETSGAGIRQVYSRDRKDYQPQSGEGAVGKYIDYVHSATWMVNITKPGGYTVWYRYGSPASGTAAPGSSGSWTHQDQKDAEANLTMHVKPPRPDGWFWLSAHPSYFAAGVRRLAVTNMGNGLRIDRLALVPHGTAFKPGDIEPPATPTQVVSEGTVTFAPLRGYGVVHWDKLTIDADDRGRRGGSIRAELSTDGKNWTSIAEPFDLSRLKPGQSHDLHVRLTLARSGESGGGDDSPRLQSIIASYQASADAFLTIENESTRLTFARADGALCGIANLTSNSVITPLGLPGPPFALAMRRPDAEQRVKALTDPSFKYDVPGITSVPFSEATLRSIDSDGRTLKASWRVRDVDVDLVASLSDSPLATWDITVTNNHREDDVVQVISPIVRHLRLGERSDDDQLAWPYTAGELLNNPAMLGDRVLDSSHCGYGFVDLFDRPLNAGFYLGNHSAVPIVTDAASRPNASHDRIELSYTKEDRIKASGGTATYRYALGPHAGDWHWGGDQYRAFFREHFPAAKDAVPEWLREVDAWYVTGMGLPIAGAKQRHYDEFNGLRVTPLQLGLRYTQIWGSTFDEACPDFYLPRAECGGAEALARTMQAWKELGGIAGFYIHGNGIGTAYAYADQYFDTPWSSYDPSLRAPDDQFLRRNEAFAAPKYRPNYAQWPRVQEQFLQQLQARGWFSSWLPNPTRMLADYRRLSWQGDALPQFLAKWTDFYIRRLNTTSLYYDTLSFGEAPEFNPYLGCNGEGTAIVNRLAYLRDVTARMRQVNPDFMSLIEGAGDVYSPYCYALLSGFSRDGEILRYTLPEMIFFEGQSNAQWETDAQSWAALSTAFINGNRLDITRLFNHAREILRLRQRLSPWFSRAIFRDTLGLRVDQSKLDARVHVLDEPGANGSRGVLIAIRNPGKLNNLLVQYELPAGMTVNAVHGFALGLERPITLSHKLEPGLVSFVAPEAPLSAVVLVDRAQGPCAWTAIRRQADVNAVAADLYSFATEPITIETDVRGANVAFSNGRQRVSLAPAELKTVTFAAAQASPDPWIEPVTMILRGDGHERVHLCGIAQAAPNGSFEASFEPLTTDEAAYDGKRSHYGVPEAYHYKALGLVPGRTYRLSVAVLGQPQGLSVYYLGDGRAASGNSTQPAASGPLGLKAAGQDRGWQIYQTIVTAGTSNALYVHSGAATRLYYYDAIRAEPVNPARPR